METSATRRGARYARISDDQAGDEHGVKNQLDTQGAYAQQRGIVIAEGHTYVDNDISATYGKPRPGYQAMMKAAARGEFDVIIVFHTSRLWRNRKERADGIEILKQAKISVEATKGPSLDMSTAYGRGMAGLLGEFDTMETEVKSERQVLAAQARAKAGRMPIGTRGFGFGNDGLPLETPTWCEVATRREVSEAEVAGEMFDHFHAGDSLVGIEKWLNKRGVPTRYGGPWRANSVRQILTNPRYCGRVVYRHRSNEPGEPVAAAFPAIVDEGVWEAVNERLSDPRRKTAYGTDRKHLGSSVYLCGICPKLVRATGAASRTAYKCPDGHLVRRAAAIDEYVTALIRERLARPDVARLVAAPAGKEAMDVSAEIRKLRQRIKRTEADYDADLISGQRFKEKTAKLQAELNQAEAQRAQLTAGSEVAGVILAPDPVRAYDGAPLGVKQAVVRFFCTVTLKHVARGIRGFDPDTVDVDWKHN